MSEEHESKDSFSPIISHPRDHHSQRKHEKRLSTHSHLSNESVVTATNMIDFEEMSKELLMLCYNHVEEQKELLKDMDKSRIGIHYKEANKKNLHSPSGKFLTPLTVIDEENLVSPSMGKWKETLETFFARMKNYFRAMVDTHQYI